MGLLGQEGLVSVESQAALVLGSLGVDDWVLPPLLVRMVVVDLCRPSVRVPGLLWWVVVSVVLATAAISAVAGTDVGPVGHAVRAGGVVVVEEEEEDFGASGNEAHAGARVVGSVVPLMAAGTVKHVSAAGAGAGASVATVD